MAGGGGSLGGYVPPVSPLSQHQLEAVGYAGGGVLALCLVPQIARLVVNRSARDVSALWSLLYVIGLVLTFIYLYFQGAIAAWIPLIIEMAGCITILGLKVRINRECSQWPTPATTTTTARQPSPHTNTQPPNPTKQIAFDCTAWGQKQGALAAARRRARREAGRDGLPAAGVGARIAPVPSAAVVADRRAVLAMAEVDNKDADEVGDVEADAGKASAGR
jgi:uncharacterized protein with PQ loop repeat